jgi:predicted nucleotidyltransferase
MKPIMPKDAILQILVAHKQQLIAFGVNKIGLFGSYLRNEATEQSDIDLLVDIQKEKNF